MKHVFIYIAVVATLLFTACEKDNYDAPSVTLYGSMTYQGTALSLKNGEVTFRLYEPGWELSSSTYMDVYVAQDGTFKASVFNGKTYKLIRTANIGPWENPTVSDTITVAVSGDTQQDIPVTPYFTIPTANITVSGGIATAAFSINQVVSGAVSIDKVGLYVASNIIVDATNNKAATELAGAQIDNLGNVTLSVALTDALKKEGYVYARVGVKSTLSDHLVYSQPVKVTVN